MVDLRRESYGGNGGDGTGDGGGRGGGVGELHGDTGGGEEGGGGAITTTLVDGATVGVCSTVTPADESKVVAVVGSES